ncbi:hypothetical protein VTL71DRAFT_4806, partial [Oculimacula yallundae]
MSERVNDRVTEVFEKSVCKADGLEIPCCLLWLIMIVLSTRHGTAGTTLLNPSGRIQSFHIPSVSQETQTANPPAALARLVHLPAHAVISACLTAAPFQYLVM